MINYFFYFIGFILLIALIILQYRTFQDIQCLLYGYNPNIEDLSVEEPEDKKGIDVKYNPIKNKEFYDNGEFVQIIDDMEFEAGVEVFEKHVDPVMQANKKYGV